LDISVIIPIRDGNSTLRFCLDSLKKSELPPSEVIVVDDCSREDCSDLVRSYGFKFLRVDRPREAENARNIGAQHAKGDILVFTDCDMVIQPDALGRIRKRLLSSHYAAVSGVCTPENDQRNLAARYKNLWLYYSYASSPKDFDFWISSIGAVRKDAFLSVRGFRTSFHNKYGGGDLEFGRRLRLAGWKIRLDTKIQGKHLKPYSLWGLLKNDYSRGKGWFRFAFRERFLAYVIRKLRIANIYPGFILSVVISLLLILSLILTPFHRVFIACAFVLAGIYLLVNYPLLRFFKRRAGTYFALKVLPLVLADHLAAGLGVLRAGAGCLWSLLSLHLVGLGRRSEFKKETVELDGQAEA
jgi:glycosyltransferase involved in cell wall biosynthesis